MDVLFLLPASSRCLGAWGMGFLTWHRGWAPWSPLFEHGCTALAAGIHIATFPKSWACQWFHHSQHHWQRFKNILREKVCNLDRILPFKWHKGLKVEGSESELSLEWASARVPPTPPSVGCNPGTANADGQRAWWQLLRGMWRVLRVLSVWSLANGRLESPNKRGLCAGKRQAATLEQQTLTARGLGGSCCEGCGGF